MTDDQLSFYIHHAQHTVCVQRFTLVCPNRPTLFYEYRWFHRLDDNIIRNSVASGKYFFNALTTPTKIIWWTEINARDPTPSPSRCVYSVLYLCILRGIKNKALRGSRSNMGKSTFWWSSVLYRGKFKTTSVEVRW